MLDGSCPPPLLPEPLVSINESLSPSLPLYPYDKERVYKRAKEIPPAWRTHTSPKPVPTAAAAGGRRDEAGGQSPLVPACLSVCCPPVRSPRCPPPCSHGPLVIYFPGADRITSAPAVPADACRHTRSARGIGLDTKSLFPDARKPTAGRSKCNIFVCDVLFHFFFFFYSFSTSHLTSLNLR